MFFFLTWGYWISHMWMKCNAMGHYTLCACARPIKRLWSFLTGWACPNPQMQFLTIIINRNDCWTCRTHVFVRTVRREHGLLAVVETGVVRVVTLYPSLHKLLPVSTKHAACHLGNKTTGNSQTSHTWTEVIHCHGTFHALKPETCFWACSESHSGTTFAWLTKKLKFNF